MQTVSFLRSDSIFACEIPDPEAFVLPGLSWGRAEVLFTPAYWMAQYQMRDENFPPHCHRLGRTLEEEVAACLLGGYGIPAEVGLAAFQRLRDEGFLAGHVPSVQDLAGALRRPLIIEGRRITYRFWQQKARYLGSALRILRDQSWCDCPAPVLRDRLIQLPGIGPKTASWIVRNWLGSNEVAILDIHIVRAGRLMGLYSDADKVERHYQRMERRFLALASAMEVPAANLDSLIWQQMRCSPRLVASLLNSPNHESEHVKSRYRLSRQAPQPGS